MENRMIERSENSAIMSREIQHAYQRPLLATSTLSIVRTLLDQKSNDDLQVLGRLMLVDFLNGQVDGTRMFNLEGLIPKLCKIGQELREDENGLCLRSVALQALASMVICKWQQVEPKLLETGLAYTNNAHTTNIQAGEKRNCSY